MRQWGQRSRYAVMSLFVVWHTIAMVLAPFQADAGSATPPSLQFLVQAYQTLFRLESSWAFFAPVGRSHVFRYVIEDAEGNNHTFTPIKDFKWYHPRYGWFERAYWGLMINPELFGDYYAEFFCGKHASLKPTSITLQEILEENFRPEDHLRGKHPLDSEYVTEETLKELDCPQPEDLRSATVRE